MIGDIVGLGKTLMATAFAKIFQDDHFLETLIICPRNLVSMWEDHVTEYRLRAKVLSLSGVTRELAKLRRYRVVLIDESHNLRNREGSDIGRIRNISRTTKAGASCSRPPRTTRRTSTSPTSCGSSLRRIET